MWYNVLLHYRPCVEVVYKLQASALKASVLQASAQSNSDLRSLPFSQSDRHNASVFHLFTLFDFLHISVLSIRSLSRSEVCLFVGICLKMSKSMSIEHCPTELWPGSLSLSWGTFRKFLKLFRLVDIIRLHWLSLVSWNWCTKCPIQDDHGIAIPDFMKSELRTWT